MLMRSTRHGRPNLSFDRRQIQILFVIAAISPLFIFTASLWTESRQEVIQTIGIGMIVVCILGRSWCSVFIGGRKTFELITAGPYAIIRNPLYLFSIIGASGIGAQFGAVSFAIISGACVAFAYYRRALHEEQALLALHGNDYRHYLMRVPRFLPQKWSWQSASVRRASPIVVIRTFADACFFLLAVPSAEYLQHLQHAGRIHVLVFMP